MAQDFETNLEPGFRLDRYELLCPIAQGGMAQVWLARLHGKRGFEKLVAVKMILTQYATDLRFQQMFLDEARIASGIEHANVAQIFDLGEQGDILYLVMEWVDGESLSKLYRASERGGAHIPPGIVARIMADACAGLHAAHELADKDNNPLNVVHRDVSPQNILVSVKGAVKLIDFGIAKARDRMSGDTTTGMFKGKILYMAPEQAIGQAVDRRSDVWAVGAVMYHMLTGVPAYEGENQLATLHLLTSATAEFNPLPDTVPEPLRKVIARALVRDRDKRIPTAAELGGLIEDAMAAAGLKEGPKEVAAFVNERLKDRNDARKKAVDLALEAASERARRSLGPLTDPDSESGHQPLRTLGRAPEPPSSAPSIPQAPAVPIDVMEPTSTATLGSAALVADGIIPAPASRARVAMMVGGVAAVLLVAVALFVGLHKTAPPETSASPPPTTEQTQRALPKIPPPPPMDIATAAASSAAPTATHAPDAAHSASKPPATRPTAATTTPTARATTAPTASTRKIDDGF